MAYGSEALCTDHTSAPAESSMNQVKQWGVRGEPDITRALRTTMEKTHEVYENNRKKALSRLNDQSIVITKHAEKSRRDMRDLAIKKTKYCHKAH